MNIYVLTNYNNVMIRIFILKENQEYICINVDNDDDAQMLLNKGAKELSQEQIQSTFGEYAYLASPLNTTVSEDGNNITFNYTPSSLEELKSNKLQQLRTSIDKFEQNVCKDMVIQSSLGFPIDGDRRSQNNIQGQLTVAKTYNIGKISYRCADNVIRDLTVTDLETLYNETVINISNLYKQKWELENEINTATSKEELDSIKVQFIMLNFTDKQL